MGNILDFPNPPDDPSRTRAPLAIVVPRLVPAGALPRIDIAARRDMTLGELAQRLRFDRYAQRTQIDKLRALHAHRGLPLPRNPRIVAGVPADGADNIHARSIWDRGEALAWLDHTFPVAAIADRGDPVAARATLAANAARIAGEERRRA